MGLKIYRMIFCIRIYHSFLHHRPFQPLSNDFFSLPLFQIIPVTFPLCLYPNISWADSAAVFQSLAQKSSATIHVSHQHIMKRMYLSCLLCLELLGAVSFSLYPFSPCWWVRISTAERSNYRTLLSISFNPCTLIR